jgi:hypothetical protein
LRGSREGRGDPTTPLARLGSVSGHHLDGEIVAEEDASAEDAVDPVRRLPGPAPEATLPVLRPEMKSAAIAAAGGVLAGAATVAAVRVVGSAVGSRGSASRRLSRRRRPGKVVASRSFLVDVHLLDR